MSETGTIRCFVMGDGTLLVQCAELLRGAGFHVEGVITGNDEIRQWASTSGVHVLEPGTGRQGKQNKRTLAERIEAASEGRPFEWFFSIANLRIIPEEVLALPTQGAINFHDGPLPRYAGLNAPVWAIKNSERTHGVSWHLIEGGVDEGDVLAQRIFDIREQETALTLNTRCYEAGIESFAELAKQLASGAHERTPQDLSQRNYVGKFDRPFAACTIDFSRDKHEVEALVRALDHGRYRNPVGVPKAWVKKAETWSPIVLSGIAEVADETPSDAEPGTVLRVDDEVLVVATTSGAVAFSGLHTPSGQPIDATRAQELGLRRGAVLALPEDIANSIEDASKSAAKAEEAITARLVEPSLVVGAAGWDASGEIELKRVKLAFGDSTQLVAALSIWAQRSAGLKRSTIGLRAAHLIDGVHGLFSETLPLRLRVRGKDTSEKHLEASAREFERAKARGTFLIDLLQREPEISDVNFDVVIAESDGELDGAIGAGASLVFVCDGSAIELVVNTARLPLENAERIATRLHTIVEALASKQNVSEISLMSEAEKNRVLNEWNATQKDYERACIHELFEAQVDRTPDAPALVFQDEVMSYRQLDERANAVATKLIKEGLELDEAVGLCVDRSPHMLIGALAIAKAGGAYVPLDPTYPGERLSFMLEDSQARFVLTQRKLEEVLNTNAARFYLDELSGSEAERPNIAGLTPNNLAYLIYTSGSTGKPKGVMVEHGNVANFFAGMDDRIPSGSSDSPGTWLAVTSLSFDISVLELFWTLSRGFKVVLSSDEDRTLVSGGASGGAARSSRPIDFGLFYFSSDEGEHDDNKYRLLLEGAKFADENGFSAVWTPERHFHAFGGLYPNPAVSSAAIAAITKNVTIRAGSCVSPLHHPVRIAEDWAVVDNISGGRVSISFAAGWQPNDFILRPDSFGIHKQRMIEEIDVIRSLWRGETVEFDGPRGKVNVQTLPRPVQKELPFLITAAGNPATFELAGKMGAGILTHLLGQSMDEAQEKIALYRKAYKDAGHSGEGLVVLMLHTFVGEDEDEVREIVREPMKGYLRSSIMLIQQHAWAFPAFKRVADKEASFQDNFMKLSEEDTDAMLDHSFERYYETSALFGTPESCQRMVEDCKRIGVDEIACLIDFGVDSTSVLDSLPALAQLLSESNANTGASDDAEPPSDDFSIAAQIRRNAVTHLQCTPSMARMLTLNDEAKAALSGLTHMMVGGEALPVALAKELQDAVGGTVQNMYGPTETTIWSSTSNVSGDDISIGTPIANTQLYVLDENKNPVPIGSEGELWIGGDGVTRGYFNRQALTRDRFVKNPFAEGRMYRTGDAVRWRSDGALDFIGRIDNQVKIRGYRMELGEIEARLETHLDVIDAVVIAREDSPGDKRLVAYYRSDKGALEDDTLKTHLLTSLPDFMVPSRFVWLERYPLTPNKKVDRKSLPRPDSIKTTTTEYVAPESETEGVIAAIWGRLLGLSRVSTSDNFFDLGGHSLLAVQAHREIRESELGELAAELTVTDMFRFPTIESMAAHLSGAGGQSEAMKQSAERAASRRQSAQKATAGRRRVLRRRDS